MIQKLTCYLKQPHKKSRVWALLIGEYLYISSKSGLTLRHRTYAINQEEEDFLEKQVGDNP